MFILTITKIVVDQIHSLISIPTTITTATLTWVETDFLELLLFCFLINTGMPLCYNANAWVYKWLPNLSSQDFCVPWAHRCLENAQSASNGYYSTSSKSVPSFLPTAKYSQGLHIHKENVRELKSWKGQRLGEMF